MARLPTADDLGYTAPRSQRTVNSYDVSRPLGPNLDVQDLAAEDRGGQMLQQAGAKLSDLYRVEMDKIDTLKAEDALNKIKQARLDMTMGDKGAYQVKGGNVLTPDYMSGYRTKFDASVEGITSGLTPQQRAKLKPHADREGMGMQSDILRHSMSESEKYQGIVEKGRIDTITNIGVRVAADPIAFERQLVDMNALVEARAKRLGLRTDNPEDKYALIALQREVQSPLLAGAITQVLSDKSASGLSRAEELMGKYGSLMDDAALLKMQGHVQSLRSDMAAGAGVEKVLAIARPDAVPDPAQRLTTLAGAPGTGNIDAARLLNLQTGVESNWQEKGKDGKILQGPMTKYGTAKGSRQVLDGTNTDPGFGVKPAQDNSPAERARVGNDYMMAMIRRYGAGKNADGTPRSEQQTIKLALAAYNWGPGNVDSALAFEKNPKNDTGQTWESRLPKETADYVAKITTKYNTGDTGRAQPTIVDAKAMLRQELAGQPRDVVEKAEAKLESKWGDYKAASAQRVDDTMLNIRQRVDSGELTHPDQLTPQEKAVLGNHVTSAQSFIESASRKSDKALALSPSGTDFYYQMREDPLRLKATSIATIMGMRGDLGSERTNKLLDERDRLIKQPDVEKQATIDAQQFKSLANLAKVTDKAQLVHYQDRAEEAIVAKQTELKRTLTREEKKQIIISTLTELPVTTKGTFWGTNTVTKRGGDVQYKQNIQVPEAFAKGKRAEAKARGYGELSDDQVRGMYAMALANEQGLR